MTFSVQWVALAVMVACTLWRLPTLLRGQGRGMFWIFASMTLCVALSIAPIYLAVDAVLGERNIANVVLRISLFVIFFLLGTRIADAYDSTWARRLIRGPVGIAMLVLCIVGVWASYFASDVAGSSVGMASLSTQTSIEVYKWFGLAYPAYIAAVVVIPTAAAAFSQRPPIARTAAAFMAMGFALTAALVPVHALELPHSIETPVGFVAILLTAVGFSLVWLSVRTQKRPVAPRGRGGS